MTDQQATVEEVESGGKRRERRDAVENRQRLLAEAKKLFARQGASETSMHEIARAAGVGQGTLYRHFADKGELCHALIREDLAEFRERIGALLADRIRFPSPLGRLELLIREKNQLTESHLPLFAVMAEESAKPGKKGPFRGPFHTWLRDQITALLEEATALGETGDLDIGFTADALLAAVAPHLYSYQRQELGYTRERINVAMQRLFVDGLRLK
ncbi:MAG TPA: TetR/AcrR family transcriptional regulator [Roseiflexaceae bacterium]|nr:TetR/AcrR family transcriptional regulator [Roseiflexaceae bacterium]